MENPTPDKIYLEIDGLYYPQPVFDETLGRVMAKVLQRIIDSGKSPQHVMRATNQLKQTRAGRAIMRYTMKLVREENEGVKKDEIPAGKIALPQKRPA